MMAEPKRDETYKPVDKNPLQVRRSVTNIKSLVFLILMYLMWFASIIYGFATSKREIDYEILDNLNVRETLNGISSSVDFVLVLRLFFIRGSIVLLCTLIMVSLLYLGFLAIFRCHPKTFTKLGIWCLYVALVLTLIGFIQNIVNGRAYKFGDCLSLLRYIIFTVAIIMCTRVLGVGPIFEIVKKAVPAIFFYPSLILFVLLMKLVAMLIYVSSILAIFYSFKASNGETKEIGDIVGLVVAITLGGIYVFVTICSFENMVISQSTAIYHWTSNKADIPSGVVFKCAGTVMKHHVGSIGYSATCIVPFVKGIFVLFKSNLIGDQKYPNKFIEWVYKVFLLFNIMPYAEQVVAMYGYSYSKAIRKSFDILVKNYTTAFSLHGVFYSIIQLGFACTMLITLLLLMAIFGASDLFPTDDASGHDVMTKYLIFILMFTAIALLAFLLLIPVILAPMNVALATLLCTLEDEEELNILEENRASIGFNVGL